MRIGAAAMTAFALMLTNGVAESAFAADATPAAGDAWQKLDGADVASVVAASTISPATQTALTSSPSNSSGDASGASHAQTMVTQSGVRPNNVNVVKGHGARVALNRMMRALLPRGFTVDYGDVPATRTVTWKGGSAWDVALADALDSLGDVSADIDWEQRHVTLAHVDPSEKAAATNDAQPAISGGSFSSALPGTYDLSAGESLESQLSDWAKRAGWSVTWNTSDDWIVPHSSSYGSDFQQAITQVINQMESNGADVRGDIWTGNHTVVIDRAGVN